jgi:hypothetical protein
MKIINGILFSIVACCSLSAMMTPDEQILARIFMIPVGVQNNNSVLEQYIKTEEAVRVLRELGKAERFDDLQEYYTILVENFKGKSDIAQIVSCLSTTCDKESVNCVYGFYKAYPQFLFEKVTKNYTIVDVGIHQANVYLFEMLHNTFDLHRFCECCFNSNASCCNVRWIDRPLDIMVGQTELNDINVCNAAADRSTKDRPELYNERCEALKRLLRKIRSENTAYLVHYNDWYNNNK